MAYSIDELENYTGLSGSRLGNAGRMSLNNSHYNRNSAALIKSEGNQVMRTIAKKVLNQFWRYY